MIDASAYRVLVVDDEEGMCEAARAEIMTIDSSDRIHVDMAYTGGTAVAKVRNTVYDLILLDIRRQKELMGYAVYRKLNEMGCRSDVLLMTRFDLDPAVKPLIRLVASQGSLRVVGFLDKREKEVSSIREEVRKHYEDFRATKLTSSNLNLAGQIIDRRRKRYERAGLFPLRNAVSEIDAEVERLLQSLYVEVPEAPKASAPATEVMVSLEPIERRGLSAAVVVNATVNIGFRGAGQIRDGHKTVLKIGPKPDILEEASRYREFVRYGVKLSQRVELLGVAVRDSLGALVYSFAGGLHGKQLVSLDDLLTNDIIDSGSFLSREILRDLFKFRNWYSVHVDDVDVSRYFNENYRTALFRSCGEAELQLQQLPELLGSSVKVDQLAAAGKEEAHFQLSLGGAKSLKLPTSSVLGLGSMYRAVPACLVHGDMHAGNVMVEISIEDSLQKDGERRPRRKFDRSCLIDFRNSGPGPRTVDAVALEASIRLSDSEATCRQLYGSGESGLSSNELLAVAQLMLDRVDDELALYRAVFNGDNMPSSDWCGLAAEVLEGLRGCFKDVGEVGLEEYLRTSIRYTLRQLGFKMPPVARVRVLAWLAAQYQLLPP